MQQKKEISNVKCTQIGFGIICAQNDVWQRADVSKNGDTKFINILSSLNSILSGFLFRFDSLTLKVTLEQWQDMWQ